MAGSFDLKRSGDKFIFSLKAGNGEIILSSQRYASKQSAEEGIASVRTNAQLDERFERADSATGQPYFKLLAANKQVIGTSEMYSAKASRDNGIASVKANAPTAAVKDNT